MFRSEDWKHYQAVNQKFAEAVCSEVDSDDPIVLVQDYHFALLPRMIRERLPRATVLTFWHIPWPNSERFGICPWRDELLAGMLGSSILGFHTQYHCNNFLDTVDRFLESRIDREQNAVVHQRQWTLVRPYPDLDRVAEHSGGSVVPAPARVPGGGVRGTGPPAGRPAGRRRRPPRLHEGHRGAPARRGAAAGATSRACAAASRSCSWPRRAEPSSRSTGSSTTESRRSPARVNERFASGSYRPVILLRAHHEPPRVFRFYRAADVCYVSSLHDGMNLVAKEFVAARDDERGVLVLSHFTGAARELTEALIVNPYDLEEASEALAAALNMPAEEQQDRMRSMRAFVAEFNVYRWAGRMLVDAARLRRRERLTGRLRGLWLDGGPIR